MHDRALSFGSVAEHYDRFRPAPPPEVAEWLVPPGAQRVADVCAGTGGLSRVLADRVPGVVAVDLDTRMLAVLQARTPRPAAVCARGEVLPFGDGTLDAVLVASGWHWLDPELAVPEAARVLRPGGVLGVVWNSPDRRVEWVGDLLQHRRAADDAEARGRRQLAIPPGVPFGEPEQRVVDWSLPRTPSELIGLAGTYSSVIASGFDEQLSVARRAATVVERHPLLQGRASVSLPLRARCWRAVRLAD